MRTIFLFCCTAALVLGARFAEAQILKCKDAENRVVYTQGSCPPDTRPVESVELKDPAAVRNAANCSGRDRMSAAAVALQKQSFDCFTGGKHGPGCQPYRDLVQRCKKPENRESADCASLREFKSAHKCDADKLQASMPAPEPAPLRCEVIADLAFHASDAQVRDCSRKLSFPSTSSWAQVGERIELQPHLGGIKQWIGDYLCLSVIGVPGGIPGETIRVRPGVTVKQAVRESRLVPGFEIEGHATIFPTKVAAVEAGCQAPARR